MEAVEENRRKWLEELRSGKYIQGRNHLRFINGLGEPRYCCLGVAQEMFEPDGFDVAVGLPTQSVRDALGIVNSDMSLAVEMNDMERKTFEQIADEMAIRWNL